MRPAIWLLLLSLAMPGFANTKTANLLRFVKRPGVVDTAKLTKFLQSDAVTNDAIQIKFDTVDEHGWNIFHHFAASTHKGIMFGELGSEAVLTMARKAVSKEEFAAMLNTQITATADHPIVEIGDTVGHILPRLNGDHSGAGERWFTSLRGYIDPNIKNSKGMTPYFEAIAHGKGEQMKTLRFAYEVDESVMSPLHVAVANAQTSVIHELLRVHEVTYYDNTLTPALAELNEQGETVIQHIDRLIEQYQDELKLYENEVEQFVGENVYLVKQLFLQGKSPFASPKEYHLMVKRLERFDYVRSSLKDKEGGSYEYERPLRSRRYWPETGLKFN